MTGFARAAGETTACSWAWEVRSVNGKGLDVRCRLPSGFEALEPRVRERITATLKRGNVGANLTVVWIERPGGVQVNLRALDQIIALLPEIHRRLPHCAPPRPEGLLNVRGVIEVVDEQASDEIRAAVDEAVLAGLDGALASLAAMRREEGARMAGVLADHLGRIGVLHGEAGALAAGQPAAIRARLEEQVAALLIAVPALPEERLAQEVALLATKADAREELDRLKAHLEAAHALLAGGGPVGRKLEFLCQELHREANTLCSKSADVALTRVGIDLKATIEQLREQVQNVE
ncbi:MAG: YicC/YloC family endoribonuclease [Rhodospirillales bacterium]